MEKLVRKRVAISMNSRDKKSRTADGNRIAAQANELLKNGYHFTKEKVAIQPGKTPQSEILTKALQFALEASAPALGKKTVGPSKRYQQVGRISIEA